MLDITDHDIAGLSDADLRELVGRLTAGFLRGQGFSTAGVTRGGSQDAPDGGLDVRVSVPTLATAGWVPRTETGFQVKKPDMAPAAITAEMRPHGALRPSIADLADRGGAYIIVSSGTSATDKALQKRLEAMRKAVADHPAAERLALDFYDRQRLAAWVREHPALVPWAVQRAGRSVSGWQSHDDWSHAGTSDAFIVANGPRLHAVGRSRNDGLPTVEGLERLREILGRPGSSVRLLGLSGVGKTRFAQALFDEAVGTGALDSSAALYADIGGGPSPSPETAMKDLLRERRRAVLVVDNCPADLHGRLTRLCRDGEVSLLTIEYDIQDDQPEGSQAWRLEPGSPSLVAAVVARRRPSLSRIDTDTIGDFSGGNLRVGLALADALDPGEGVAGLADEALFHRLFRQRQSDDSGLLISAEVCSLLYSFDGKDTGADGELARLARLAGCNVLVLHRHVAELARRQLVQRRGQWRAVLPHAIANRLAARALDNLPPQAVKEALVSAPPRVLRSFTRRLGLLGGSSVAAEMAKAWLLPGGMLGDVANLDDLGVALVANVAPLAPAAALEAVRRAAQGLSAEAFVSSRNPHRYGWARLLRKLAYDAELFDTSTGLLAAFAEAEGDEVAGDNWAAQALASLFSPALSGTRAAPGQRFRAMRGLLASPRRRARELGVLALQAALRISHFTSAYDFSFGFRSRDHGWMPENPEEVTAWFAAAIGVAAEFGRPGLEGADTVRATLAQALGELCRWSGALDAIEAAARTIAGNGFWADGWLAVREARLLAEELTEADPDGRLRMLEERLAAEALPDLVRAYALRDDPWSLLGPAADEIEDGMARLQKTAADLGARVAAVPNELSQLLPEVATARGTLAWHFAKGLAAAVPDRAGTWRRLSETVAAAGKQGSVTAVVGYLAGWRERDPAGAEAALADAAGCSAAALWFPQAQVAAGLGGPAVERLLRSLSSGTAGAFRCLGYAGDVGSVCASDQEAVATVARAVADVPGGWAVAVEVVAVHLRRQGGITPPQALVDLAKDLLVHFNDPAGCKRLDHDLAKLASTCLRAPDSDAVAAQVCRTLVDALAVAKLGRHDYRGLIAVLLDVQPNVALDAFLRGGLDRRLVRGYAHGLEGMPGLPSHPIRNVPVGRLLVWCARDPQANYELAADWVPLTTRAAPGGAPNWSEAALGVLCGAPDPERVLGRLAKRLSPQVWSGSRAALLEANVALLDRLADVGDGRLAVAVAERQRALLDEACRERALETACSKHEDEAFE